MKVFLPPTCHPLLKTSIFIFLEVKAVVSKDKPWVQRVSSEEVSQWSREKVRKEGDGSMNAQVLKE